MSTAYTDKQTRHLTNCEERCYTVEKSKYGLRERKKRELAEKSG
ncbi:8196_t:CDS:1, partial [Funneliformis geosporum]